MKFADWWTTAKGVFKSAFGVRLGPVLLGISVFGCLALVAFVIMVFIGVING